MLKNVMSFIDVVWRYFTPPAKRRYYAWIVFTPCIFSKIPQNRMLRKIPLKILHKLNISQCNKKYKLQEYVFVVCLNTKVKNKIFSFLVFFRTGIITIWFLSAVNYEVIFILDEYQEDVFLFFFFFLQCCLCGI